MTPARPRPPREPGMPWAAAKASASLSVLFLVVYGACNHLTSLRSDVGTWAYAWERHIPFVPLMIVPYLSIDLFFVAAPFLCRDRRELRVLGLRIALAILIAAVCFLAMPLRFSFDRPPAPGWLGAMFDWFRGMDKPFNQFPSLHIALRTILAVTYARHTRGPTWLACTMWFSLIGLSTVLTYQHHVIDIVGGFGLAAVCFYAVGEAPWRRPIARNFRIAVYYAAATAVLVVAAALSWRCGGWLLAWFAVSTALVTAAYLGVGPGIFRKHDGGLPWSSRLLLAPVIAGQWLSLRHYAKRSNAWDRVTDRLRIGRTLNDREARQALGEGVTAVLDLTGELPEAKPFRTCPAYLNLPVMDLTAPTDAQFGDALDFIAQHVDAGRTVYVHCKAGYSRSAAVVAAYLLHAGRAASADEAAALLRAARPGIIIRPEALRAIARGRDAAQRRPPDAVARERHAPGDRTDSDFLSLTT